MNTTVSAHDIHRLLDAEHDDPFGVLGLHQIGQVWVVCSLRPDAKELAIVDRHHLERRFPATRIAEEGLFEARLEGVTEAFDEAWINNDAAALAALYTEDAVLVMDTGPGGHSETLFRPVQASAFQQPYQQTRPIFPSHYRDGCQ
jgi:hypothetical protein